MRFAYQDRKIRAQRIGREMFHPERIVFFLHDEASFERSHAFAIQATALFELEAGMEDVLSHVVVVTATSPTEESDPHEWIHGDCNETSLDTLFPLDPLRSITITPPEDSFHAGTERGAEFSWDPVYFGLEPWDIQRMAWGIRYYDNYCEYEKVADTGDLFVFFHYLQRDL